ncbi:transposase [Streptomyces sp. NPDC057474]|uniref:transposase n=1 Tax=Streptomyces sp. NPDC057474 TaxID=3346144 RepID=UPI0036AFF8C1
MLFPHLAGVVVELVERAVAGVVTLHARARSSGAECPHCGSTSGRVHGRYIRRLADAAVGGARVEIICRDRVGAYAEGARNGAPQAVQVADAWHLWHNLGEAVEKIVSAHHACVRAGFESTAPAAPPTSDDIWQTPPPAPAAEMLDVCGRERRLVTRTRERYIAVRQLLDGSTLENICRTMQLDRSTVRRFARATSIDELLVKATNRSTILDEYKPYLHQRWNEGCHDTAQLHQEIVTLGFIGSIQTVQRYLRPLKAAIATPPARRPAPRSRRIVRWIMTDPGNLAAHDAADLKKIRTNCPELDAVTHHVRDFATMMRDLRGDQLPAWMERVLADDLPALHSLINGLSRDIDAVTAGLSTPWSSGQVEGQATRTKLLKRQGYGRANLDLLRKRVLLTP